MNRTTAILVLLLAAALEAGGDALMRLGLHKNIPGQRLLNSCATPFPMMPTQFTVFTKV